MFYVFFFHRHPVLQQSFPPVRRAAGWSYCPFFILYLTLASLAPEVSRIHLLSSTLAILWAQSTIPSSSAVTHVHLIPGLPASMFTSLECNFHNQQK